MGVASALIAEGVSIDTAPALGTSGGAWAAAAILAGLSHHRVSEVIRHIRLPDWHSDRLTDVGGELFADQMQPLLWTSAVRLRTGRRILLWGGEHPVPVILAASSAVPLMLVPQRVGGRLYLDGGARSWISADLAPLADRLLVVAPGVAPAFRSFGGLLSRHLAYEVGRWERRSGGRALVVGPEPDLGRRVRCWKDLFDHSLAAEAYERACVQVRRELTAGGRLHELSGK
jgi:predicted acylesterase/phospholipase RssA